jgi:hypothetical protein
MLSATMSKSTEAYKYSDTTRPRDTNLGLENACSSNMYGIIYYIHILSQDEVAELRSHPDCVAAKLPS